jgi:hypothetical protein
MSQDLSNVDLLEILRDLAYAGLQPKEVRRTFFKRAEQLGRDWEQDIKVLLVVYHSIGNNPANLTNPDKVQNVNTGRAASDLMKLYDVKQRKTTGSNVLTLPRLAISFCHLLMAIKEAAATAGCLQNQFSDSGLPSRFQDPALAFLANQAGYEEQYRRYHIAFSRAIKRDCTEEEALRWLDVSLNGSAGDPYATAKNPSQILIAEHEAAVKGKP